MDCSKIVQVLADYAVGGLDEPTAEQVRSHLADCADCRRELKALQTTAELLEPIEQTAPPSHLWSAIEERLQPRQAVRPAWRVHFKPLMAAAAVVLLLVAVFALIPSGNGPGMPGSDLPVLADADGTSYAETQIAAAWDQPLADEASLALAMAAIQPVERDEVIQ